MDTERVACLTVSGTGFSRLFQVEIKRRRQKWFTEPLLGKEMRGVGLMLTRQIPGSGLLYKRRHRWLELTFENCWLEGELTFGNLFQESW